MLAGAAPALAGPISVVTQQDLRFGTVAKDGSARGWVKVAVPAGRRTVGGTLVALGGDYGPAQFEVVGDPYASFSIALPVQISAHKKVVVKKFNSDPEHTGTLDGNGRATVTVGGKLISKSGGTAGAYTAPFTIEVQYQ